MSLVKRRREQGICGGNKWRMVETSTKQRNRWHADCPKTEINQESSNPTSNLTAWMTQSKIDYKELLVNHGVDKLLVERMKKEMLDFYNLPVEEKMIYKLKAGEYEGYGQTIIHDQDQKVDWPDRFYMITNPLHRRKPHLLPKLPPSLRSLLCSTYRIIMVVYVAIRCFNMNLQSRVNLIDFAKLNMSSGNGDEFVVCYMQSMCLFSTRKCVQGQGVYLIEVAVGEIGMTMKITPLQEITPDKGKANIKVKIVSLWNQYYNNNPSKVAGMDMILMDEQGTKIHATINSSVVCDFDSLLKENNYHIISNFNVKRNVDSTKLSKHEFKIHFYRKTNVRNCSEFICTDDVMEFISFKDFLDARIDQSYSFGLILQMLHLPKSVKIKIHIRVQDETGSATFCLFQQEVAKLLGKSVGYLISLIDKDEENISYPSDLESIVSKKFVFKLQVSAYNVNNNYHIFTVNKLTDDKGVMNLIGTKDTEEEENKTAEVGTKRKNIEFQNSEMEKKPKVEHQDTEDDTVINEIDEKDVMKSSLSKQTEEQQCKTTAGETYGDNMEG
ncbi:oxoglutarate/iron-dependent dioxygenase [Artemisia annua]|uniref:Oxoglutarate/iron-dependent dioxygenase n=1 Tax=Artemisia annua TaxID=35608 RepID=A0A2U1NN34_ARTAN|nr:oxoglutarate/iron-dependent dioxygenase [Artemisia annua]